MGQPKLTRVRGAVGWQYVPEKRGCEEEEMCLKKSR